MQRYREVASPEARQCLRLHLVEGIGPQRFRQLLEAFGDIDHVLRASASQLRQVPHIGPRLGATLTGQQRPNVDEELQRAQKLAIRILCQADGAYPDLLQQLPDAPVCLYVMGELQRPDRSALAIVGSRRCTHYGAEQALQLGMASGRLGLTVVSGLATGIDAHAHRGALEAHGHTVAVLGAGLGHLRTHHNRDLGRRILAGQGAVLSELPIEHPPQRATFPQRNRIIAGLSLGTVVVEAATRSGALITARFTAEYNRELFALPGRADSALSAGCNRLIQRGAAKLVLNVEDVIEELAHAAPALIDSYQRRADTLLERTNLSEDERQVWDMLSTEGTTLESICDHAVLPPEKISSALTMLQLKGVVEQLPGNRFARIGVRTGG